MRPILVGHGQAKRMAAHRSDKFPVQWFAMGLPQLPGSLTQLTDCPAQLMDRRIGRQWSSK
jgi:hypothetical protein